MTRHEEEIIQGAGGAALPVYATLPPDVPKGLLIIVHGFAEYGSRYRNLSRDFAEKGLVVWVYDQRGHGRQEGPRGVMGSYEEFLDDLDLAVREMQARWPELPLFLYGHSMGGNITLNYLMRRKPAAVKASILSSPWLRLHKGTPYWAVRMMERVLGSRYQVKTKLHSLSHDREYLRAIADPTLHHNLISTGMARGIMEGGRYALSHPQELQVPTLLMSAGDDLVVDTRAIRQLADSGNTLITYRNWPGYWHELHNENGREEVFQEVWRYLSEKLPQEGGE